MDAEMTPKPEPRHHVTTTDPMLLIITTLIRSGVLGSVLAWALMQNMRMTERMFLLIENNTKALEKISNHIPGGITWQP